jgi:transposase-like protein
VTDEERAYRSELIGEQEASGQTIRAFCKERGVADHCFYFWRKRLGLGRRELVPFARC